MVAAVSRVAKVHYAEIVASISSKSAGPGTRANIDEFTETTKAAIEKLGGAERGKAISDVTLRDGSRGGIALPRDPENGVEGYLLLPCFESCRHEVCDGTLIFCAMPNSSFRSPRSLQPKAKVPPARSKSTASAAAGVKIRIGFLLAPRFTLVAFAGFVDALRLAADEGDRSRQRLCTWSVLGNDDAPVISSCGAGVTPNAPMESPWSYDFLVVVGGLVHGGQQVPRGVYPFLREAAAHGVKLVGLCTGSFILARAGLLEGHLACVSWFHREAFTAEFPDIRVISNQMFVVDRERLTCAGGTSVVHLAAHLIEHGIGRASAVKALRIMIEEQPMPSRTLQPEEVLTERSTDTVVHKAMLLLEQQLQSSSSIEELCKPLGIGRRQLERRFQRDIGLSPAQYRLKLRLQRARWLLQNTDLEVMEIGLQCGFQDAAHFARVVKKELGSTPSQVRAADQPAIDVGTSVAASSGGRTHQHEGGN